MSNVRAEELSMTEWDGGVLPYSVGHKKLGMWLFIVSDALTFSALLIGYSYLRFPRPIGRHLSSLAQYRFSSLMTFCLLSSSLTWCWVNAAQRQDRAGTVKWILLTIVGGVAFMGLHLKEWTNLFHEGITLVSNPWGVPQFGATFFGITGLHMFHVLTGVLYLAGMAVGVSRGKYGAEHVEVCGLYWHFVDLVWMFVFPLVYLLSVKMH
jgi:heme/copper-type cytochrome/quinol oxidase subunit 3